jgi:putative transposase
MVGTAAKRAGVAHLKAKMGLSERRDCSIVGADRKMIHYRSRRPPDTELRARLRELANERRRLGYRRLLILLRREGEPSGINPSTGSIGKKGSPCVGSRRMKSQGQVRAGTNFKLD